MLDITAFYYISGCSRPFNGIKSLRNFFTYLILICLQINIRENNDGNFLSAGEMPLPALYFMMALLFLLSGSFWVFILRKSR